jgi:DNA-binding CsgD family transcriptional regulator
LHIAVSSKAQNHMNQLKKFSEYVGNIYDCIPDPAGWQNTLQKLTDHYGGVLATLAVLDTETRQSRFGAYCGDPAIVIPLITTYAQHMPYFDIIPKMEVDTPYTIADLDRASGTVEGSRMMMGKMGEWTSAHHVIDAICLNLLKQENRIGTFVITTTDKRGPIRRDELDEFAILAPHIRRAITISDLFEMEQRDATIFRDVIDAFSSAVFIVSSDMKLHHANKIAENLLREKIVIQSNANSISFPHLLADAAIRKAVLTGERSEIALGASGIGVPLARDTRPAIAHVLPLARRAESSQFHTKATAAIFVAAAGASPMPAIDAFAALFGLTAAEKRVTNHLAQGMTRAEIALANGVSDGTVKTQLDAIFDKTNTSNQRTLEMLIRDLTPPVKSD